MNKNSFKILASPGVVRTGWESQQQKLERNKCTWIHVQLEREISSPFLHYRTRKATWNRTTANHFYTLSSRPTSWLPMSLSRLLCHSDMTPLWNEQKQGSILHELICRHCLNTDYSSSGALWAACTLCKLQYYAHFSQSYRYSKPSKNLNLLWHNFRYARKIN
jgi:hypothetical protein